jgi:DNA repair exonuclease SbcCD nuclease subunit
VKIGILGDLHISTHKPANRKDKDYFETQFNKFKWAVEKAQDQWCKYLCLPGDIFDSPRTPLQAIEHYIRYLTAVGNEDFNYLKILAVYGQHDLYFHSMNSVPKTPLNILQAAGVVEILNDQPYADQNVAFYGASWDAPVPTPINADAVNVLLIHTMMVGERKAWEGQENYSAGRAFLREHNLYSLVCSGDNHQQFFYTGGKRSLVNAGSVMRSRIDQVDHHPALFVYDTELLQLSHYDILCLPADEVLDVEKTEETKERDERIEAFVNSLDTNISKDEINFKRNLINFVEANKIERPVAEIIYQCLGE